MVCWHAVGGRRYFWLVILWCDVMYTSILVFSTYYSIICRVWMCAHCFHPKSVHILYSWKQSKQQTSCHGHIEFGKNKYQICSFRNNGFMFVYLLSALMASFLKSYSDTVLFCLDSCEPCYLSLVCMVWYFKLNTENQSNQQNCSRSLAERMDRRTLRSWGGSLSSAQNIRVDYSVIPKLRVLDI